MAKKLVRKALEMLRKLATEESEDEEGEGDGEVCMRVVYHVYHMYHMYRCIVYQYHVYPIPLVFCMFFSPRSETLLI